jgi:hypothetical protein
MVVQTLYLNESKETLGRLEIRVLDILHGV